MLMCDVDWYFFGFEVIEYWICSLCLYGLGCFVIVLLFVFGIGFLLCVIVLFDVVVCDV